jgi:hypothetical protein
MLTPEDRFEINDLYARYNHAIDTQDGVKYAQCFTADGVLYPGVDKYAGQEVRGTDALRAVASDKEGFIAHRLWTSNILVEERDDRIIGTCYCLVIDIGGDQPRMAASVTYHDKLTKVEGTWRFVSRRPVPDSADFIDTRPR